MISCWWGNHETVLKRIINDIQKPHNLAEDFVMRDIKASSPFFTVAGEVLTSVIDFAIVNARALILCNASPTGHIIQDQTYTTINAVNLQD